MDFLSLRSIYNHSGCAVNAWWMGGIRARAFCAESPNQSFSMKATCVIAGLAGIV